MTTTAPTDEPGAPNPNAAPGDPDFPSIDQMAEMRFTDRLPFLCKLWASQKNPTPFAIIAMYWTKYFLLFIGGWMFFASFRSEASFWSFDWFFTWQSFEKAAVWCMFYELMGFGCSSGPMNGKFKPLIGGFLYFGRPGTTKLSLVPDWPILGGVTRTERRELADFGRELGLAFQIRDDALDYVSGEDILGKQRFADLREGKVTLPLLLALKRCTGAEREAAADILKRVSHDQLRGAAGEAAVSDEDLEPALEVVRRYRGVEDSIRRAEEHVGKARAAIAPFPDGPPKEALLAAADFAVERDR